MGLFSSKSKSTSSTSYTDNSTNLSVDMSSGDLSSGATKNIVAGGNVNVDGLSEDLASQIFGVMQDTFNSSLDWVQNAIDTNSQNIAKTNASTVSALQTAYNSEQATISSFKTYALYAVIAFVAWSYFRSK